MSAIVANCAINLNCELTEPVKVQYLDGNLFSMDNAGNTAHVYVYYNGQPQEIVGSVSADVIRADGSTVAVTGAMSGNRAYVIFPQAVYAVPGVLSVVIKATEGTTTTTIAAFVANVYQSSTDTVVDPGTIIPSVDALIAAIQTAVASIPSDYSALLATIATDYSPSKPYPNVGSYAWYGGVLKRSIVPITTAETYDSSHWTNAILCDDVSALKSAFDSELSLMNIFKGSDSTTSGTWKSTDTGWTLFLKVKPRARYIMTAPSDRSAAYHGVKSLDSVPPADNTVFVHSTATGWTTKRTISSGNTDNGNLPDDVNYLVFYAGPTSNKTKSLPVVLNIDGVDYRKAITKITEDAFLDTINNSVQLVDNDDLFTLGAGSYFKIGSTSVVNSPTNSAFRLFIFNRSSIFRHYT